VSSWVGEGEESWDSKVEREGEGRVLVSSGGDMNLLVFVAWKDRASA